MEGGEDAESTMVVKVKGEQDGARWRVDARTDARTDRQTDQESVQIQNLGFRSIQVNSWCPQAF